MAAKKKDEDLKHMVYKSPNSIDQVLSKELLKLSLQDRNLIEEEIHGVFSLAPRESPDSLEASLRELSGELNEIPDGSPLKSAYRESQVLPETYVNTKDFRLKFLRCELFDAKKAAIRMLKFLDLASHLFGPEVLQRPMRLTDLSKDDKKMLMLNFQILPYRDQSGRPIWAWVGDHGCNHGTPASRWKVILYFRYCMSEDIETQQKGFVSLVWVSSHSSQWAGLSQLNNWEHFDYSKKMREAAPVRWCSTHWCMPELPLLHPIHIARAGLALSMGKGQARTKFHVGDRVEILYELKRYGIPVEWIPVTETGNIKTAYLKQYIRGLNFLDNARELGSLDACLIILTPRSKDVLFQGGVKAKGHPGNVMFDGMIEAKMQKCSFQSQKERSTITREIISMVQQKGGRFLTWSRQGWWEEVKEASKINYKVAQKIRLLTGKVVAKQQKSRSSTAVFQNQDNGKRRKLISSQGISDCSDSNASDGCCACMG